MTFSGTIAHGELIVPIRFQVRFGRDGELRFRVYPLPMTRDASALAWDAASNKAGGVTRYKVAAISAGGTRFESESIILKSTATRSTPTTAHLILKFDYSMASFACDHDAKTSSPTVRWLLRGFEAFPGIDGPCELGDVHMQGNYPDKGGDGISGVATIKAAGPVTNTDTWLREAEELFLHVRAVMSFAMSRQISYPIRDTWVDGQWRRIAYSQIKFRRSNQHVHHPMRMQEVFDAALASYFDPPIAAKNLRHAIEWLTMQAAYTEMRLTNVMTALENLADSNLPGSDKVYLPPKEFEAFAKRVRDFASADLQSLMEGSDEARIAAASEMRAAMKAKLQDLNRRPLFDRVMALAKQWDVPLNDLDVNEVRAAIAARNSIVHRGYYYEPGSGTREQKDLWDHVYAVRELAIRFVLTIIGFKGHYLSFRNGQHDVAFPPAASGT